MGAFRGTIEWSCPFCGYTQKDWLNPWALRLECRENRCHRRYELTLVFRPPARGKGRDPSTMMELAPMPLALMGLRRFNARTPGHEYKDADVIAGSNNQVVNSHEDDSVGD